MITKKYILLTSCLAVTACGGNTPNMEKAEYWQRHEASSAIYMQGPKAQQILHQDIADCVVEVRELENLGEIRREMPTNYYTGNNLNDRAPTPKATLDQWDTPQRDGYLYAEHKDYADFETCMVSKGWERAEYLPFTDADKAREDYLKRSTKRKKYDPRENVTSLDPAVQKPPPYKNVND